MYIHIYLNNNYITRSREWQHTTVTSTNTQIYTDTWDNAIHAWIMCYVLESVWNCFWVVVLHFMFLHKAMKAAIYLSVMNVAVSWRSIVCYGLSFVNTELLGVQPLMRGYQSAFSFWSNLVEKGIKEFSPMASSGYLGSSLNFFFSIFCMHHIFLE